MVKIVIVTSQCNNFMLPSSILGWSAINHFQGYSLYNRKIDKIGNLFIES
jgi:hypothetical protein